MEDTGTMNDYQFGNYIYTLRTRAGLSQSELAAAIGVSNKAVSNWEVGKAKPSIEVIRKLANLFQLSVDDLLNQREKKKMASTTKIMTATIIIENCNLNDTLEVSKKAAGTGGSRLGLKSGDKITVKDLLYGLMMRSGNDAAVALAEYCQSEVLKVLQKK